MTVPSTLAGVLLFCLALAAATMLLVFVLVPLFKGLGYLIGMLFRGIGWLVAHLFEFVAGTIGDAVRFIGAILASVLLAPLAVLNVLIGRWSAAGHFADSVSRECKVGAGCIYRMLIRRPLKLVMLHGLLEGVEQRVPEAMAAAPTSDKPRKRLGQFPGYTIVGSLRGGGSGAKLFIATPDPAMRARYASMPERVVIKCFALSEGSSLPQMLRESRALESAKQLGLVFDHAMEEHRFYYVMPYHAGDHLSIVTRQLHGESDTAGLEGDRLRTAIGYLCDLVHTLAVYHRGGLWHKDVKPENIIIHSGHAHLVDLGLVTPLRSAMTLTTHGTEYFRDPELVRQALRGVKVHQVNGAKFDIYAAGAVAYFIAENTFPPHGALSRFGRRSPDALRWIIRRAMADYTHRYEHADEMLADLRYVAGASDPFAVKPADLPSLRGAAVEPPPLPSPPDAVAARVGSPVPPPPPPPTPTPVFNPEPARPAAMGTPEITVTNWWTGAYRVESSADAVVPPAPTPSIRDQARAMRHETAKLRRDIRSGRLSARKAARAQVKAARSRAREVRARARSHRHRAVAERQPSLALIALGLVAVLFFGAITAGVVLARSSSNRSYAKTTVSTPGSNLPVLIVDDGRNATEAHLQRLEKVAESYERRGFDVVPGLVPDRGTLHGWLETWEQAKSGSAERKAADDLIEAAMAEMNVYGLVLVSETDSGRLDHNLIRSTAPGAKQRRHLELPAPPSSLPFLVVNDHPTRYAPETSERVEQRLAEYRLHGWNIVSDDALEADMRPLLPAGPVAAAAAFPARFHLRLAQDGFAGILHVSAPGGAGPVAERIEVKVIEAESTPALPDGDARAHRHRDAA
ncbi:MAG: hypothetical protein HKO59_02835 [Phycisphaerales bacterium]|nr:hypothetical protein [Phycisphaerae bacterium]NNF43117.1 hypothetical protein [Phycisphaerales bacterium]NNM24917.1 hypothetical protein [Phycisphaerales bacterium]